ncbi:MAG: septum formation initiator family protein [Balneolaceae bacterium]
MNKEYFNPFRWKKSFLMTAVAGFVIIWFLFIDNYSLLTRFQLDRQKTELIERTEELKNETAELEHKIKDLEDNPDLLEKIAREEYGMRKPDETVYKVKRPE